MPQFGAFMDFYAAHQVYALAFIGVATVIVVMMLPVTRAH